jgi:hypothetical protein
MACKCQAAQRRIAEIGIHDRGRVRHCGRNRSIPKAERSRGTGDPGAQRAAGDGRGRRATGSHGESS